MNNKLSNPYRSNKTNVTNKDQRWYSGAIKDFSYLTNREFKHSKFETDTNKENISTGRKSDLGKNMKNFISNYDELLSGLATHINKKPSKENFDFMKLRRESYDLSIDKNILKLNISYKKQSSTIKCIQEETSDNNEDERVLNPLYKTVKPKHSNNSKIFNLTQ
jgi:hypothetical protein